MLEDNVRGGNGLNMVEGAQAWERMGALCKNSYSSGGIPGRRRSEEREARGLTLLRRPAFIPLR